MTFISEIKHYWNFDEKDSFCTLHHQLMECQKRVQKEFASTLELNQKWEFFHKAVAEVLDIEKALEKAHKINQKAYIPSLKDPILQPDYDQFAKRLERFTSDIAKIYRDTLYPFLQMLRNVEKGWDPSTLSSIVVCTVWDAYDRWRVKDPKKEVLKAYPHFP